MRFSYILVGSTNSPNNRMQPDFGKLRLPQPLMRSVSGVSQMKPFILVISLSLMMLSGCNPKRNPGDLIIGSNGTGLVSVKNLSGTFTALYGVEVGHPNAERSNLGGHNQNLLLALFVFPPQDNVWKYSGGGSSARPWYYRFFYSARWMHYPIVIFAKPDKDGNISENTERRKFVLEFDGRNRIITIAGNKYSITVGGFVVVKLDKHWNPEVGIDEQSVEKMNIPAETRKLISECLVTLRKGIHALTNKDRS